MEETLPPTTPIKKNYVWVYIIFAIIIFGISYTVFRVGYKDKQKTKENISVQSISPEEIFKHNSKEDCWTIIENSVYDITKFTKIHKGGELILTACGVDATENFNKRPNLGTTHSSVARKILSTMKVGEIKK